MVIKLCLPHDYVSHTFTYVIHLFYLTVFFKEEESIPLV